MMNRKFMAVLLASAMFAGNAVAAAPVSTDKSSFTFEIQGFVPVICRANVDAQSVPVQAGVVPIGSLHEFCNSPSGYEVWADYSPSLANAAIIIDGHAVKLSPSGSTRISRTLLPNIDTHDLALNLPDANVQGNLSVRIVTL